MQAEQLISSGIKVFSLPDIYFRLNAILQHPDSTMQDMVQVIKYDPALSARLLQLVNSSFFGLASQIDTLDRAVNLLGTEQIHDLALSTSVIKAFDGLRPRAFSMHTFWYNSVHCGVAARLLADHCNLIDGERLFVAGLLHDLGHLIMYSQIGPQAEEAHKAANEQGLPVHRIEQHLLGFHYAHIGAELLRAWRLPISLETMVRYHVQPERAPEYSVETAILHLANAIACYPRKQWAKIILRHDPAVVGLCRRAGLDGLMLHKICDEADDLTQEAVSVLFPQTAMASSA